MPTDRYTEAVLTVIAPCLVWNIVTGVAVSRASAQSGSVHVIVDSVASFALQFAGPLAVPTSSSPP
jgi:hypothetical protein